MIPMLPFLTTQTFTTWTCCSVPSPISLQYWEFPLIFIGIYAVAFLLVGMIHDQSSVAFMTLLGIMTGSLIAYVAGILNFAVLVLELLLYYVLIWRGDI